MKKLELQNFKCFVENNIDFKDLTILTGINAAGKSSIIQAILLHDQAVRMRTGYDMDMSDVLGIDIGGPKNLVAQNAKNFGRFDFKIAVDDMAIEFEIDKENGLDVCANGEFLEEPSNICYLSAERIGPRMSYRAGSTERFKRDGSNAVYLMERADGKKLRLPEELIVDATSRKFSYQVECWMSLIMGKVMLNTKVETDKAQAELRIKNDFVQDSVIPTLTGFGISYELSVVVAGLWMAAHGKGILIVENPEAHLHPSAQSTVGKFLAMVSTTGVQVIVETHSEHIVDGARIQMFAMEKTEQFLVNYLTHQGSEMKMIQLAVDENGELSDWPEGFFDQKQRDLRELFKLRKKNGNNE